MEMVKGMKKVSKMKHKNLFLLVASTIILFLLSLPFLPENIVSHFSGDGYPRSVQNKYLVFLFFSACDILGTLCLTSWIESNLIVKSIFDEKTRSFLILYYPLLLLNLLIMIIVSSLSLNAVLILFIFNFMYLLILIISYIRSIFHKNEIR